MYIGTLTGPLILLLGETLTINFTYVGGEAETNCSDVECFGKYREKWVLCLTQNTSFTSVL